MMDDLIVEDLKKEREAYAARFNFDLEAMFRDLQAQERAGGRTIVSFSANKVQRPKAGLKAKPRKAGA